jgi:hypothetical protein
LVQVYVPQGTRLDLLKVVDASWIWARYRNWVGFVLRKDVELR